jgi:hypothetical protein
LLHRKRAPLQHLSRCSNQKSFELVMSGTPDEEVDYGVIVENPHIVTDYEWTKTWKGMTKQ